MMADPQPLCQRFPDWGATRQITHDRWPYDPFEVKNNICGTWQAQRGALEGVDIDGLQGYLAHKKQPPPLGPP